MSMNRPELSVIKLIVKIFVICLILCACDQNDSGVNTDTELRIFSMVPDDGDSDIAASGVLQVTFNQSVNLSTVSSIRENGTCSGSVQLSSDNFQSCIGLDYAGLTDNGNTIRVPYLVESDSQYKIRISTGIRAEEGGSLAEDYSTETGFTKADSNTCDQIPRERLMVAVVFGQSNSTDSSPGRKTLNRNVYMMDSNGLCSYASDPMLYKPVLDLGCVWSRLGPKIVSAGLYDNVLFISVGVGGTSVSLWVPGALYHDRITEAMDLLGNAGFSTTHFLWHQGESDRYSTADEYKTNFNLMLGSIRSRQPTTPVYVSIASRCGGDPITQIQQAQMDLVDIENYVFQGPNTDTLGFSYRYDGCHFHEGGLEAHADLWMEVLQ